MIFVDRFVRQRVSAAIGAIVFFLGFGGVGALGLWAVGGTLHDAWRAGDWVEVPAKVTGWSDGDASYAYTYEGREYLGTRVQSFVLGGSSEVDDFDERMDRKLSAAIAQGTPVTALVNPGKPWEAMLDREIRWKLLLVFLPFAIGFTVAAFVVGFMLGRKALGIAQHGAGVPLLKPQARETLTVWMFTLVWNSVAIPIGLLAIPDLYAQGEWFVLAMVVIFPIFGALMLWSALAATWRVLRAGNPFNAEFFGDFRIGKGQS